MCHYMLTAPVFYSVTTFRNCPCKEILCWLWSGLFVVSSFLVSPFFGVIGVKHIGFHLCMHIIHFVTHWQARSLTVVTAHVAKIQCNVLSVHLLQPYWLALNLSRCQYFILFCCQITHFHHQSSAGEQVAQLQAKISANRLNIRQNYGGYYYLLLK